MAITLLFLHDLTMKEKAGLVHMTERLLDEVSGVVALRNLFQPDSCPAVTFGNYCF